MKKILSIIIVILLTSVGFISNIIAEEPTSKKIIYVDDGDADYNKIQDASITCYTINTKGFSTENNNIISYENAQFLLDKIKELENEIAINPNSIEIKQLQDEIVDFAKSHELMPNDYSLENISNQITKRYFPISFLKRINLKTNSHASEWFCNFASVGEGFSLPVIILPRFIPIIVAPIPRIYMRWEAQDGYTSCGGILSGTGFLASGELNGFALGFWGIGFSIFLPPIRAYGLFGYALFASVNAEDIEFYPPNNKPQTSSPNPSNGEENVPITLSELSFRIDDEDNDLMSYTVTTDPDIGSGSGNNKGNGFYSIPISGLQSSTIYTWTVSSSDGKDTSDKTYSFTTEYLAPVVSDSYPQGKYVSTEISELKFTITDHQGDLMDYSVETSPNIGSKYDNDVISGTYNVPIIGLVTNRLYTWYVNVTDGTYWTWEKFEFSTDEAELIAYWSFDEGSGSVFYDESGNGNHGTIMGGGFADGISGTALSLDGINDYADATDFDIDDDFVISLWINPGSTHYQQAFVGKHESGGNKLLLGYYDSGNYPFKGFAVYIRGNEVNEVYRGGVMKTGWQHLVFVGEKTNPSITKVTVYKDGEVLWVHDLNSVIGDAMGKPWTIGQDWDYDEQTDFFNGLIDEIKIFNGILNQNEIQALYLNPDN